MKPSFIFSKCLCKKAFPPQLIQLIPWCMARKADLTTALASTASRTQWGTCSQLSLKYWSEQNRTSDSSPNHLHSYLLSPSLKCLQWFWYPFSWGSVQGHDFSLVPASVPMCSWRGRAYKCDPGRWSSKNRLKIFYELGVVFYCCDTSTWGRGKKVRN